MPLGTYEKLYSGTATAAISPYRFIVIATTSTESSQLVTAAAGATVPYAGVVVYTDPQALNSGARTAAAAGDVVSYQRTGRMYLEVNGSSVNIAAGDPIKATTAGVGVKAATAGNYVGAIARMAATTDGAFILVDIVDPYTIPA